jgi:hypothetical protein
MASIFDALSSSHHRHCKDHMLKAFEPTAHCRFLPGFAPHEACIEGVDGDNMHAKWLIAVNAWTQMKPR